MQHFVALNINAPITGALLERSGACLIACPQAELRLGAPARALPLLAGTRTALGTGSPCV